MACLTLYALCFTDLEESFCVFDQSGDGSITPGKLHRVANYTVRNTTTEAEVQDQILEIDYSGEKLNYPAPF